MEGCLALMEQANQNLATVFQRVQAHLLEEGRALTREKATERMRAKIPRLQKRLEDITTAKELAKKRGKELKREAFYPADPPALEEEEENEPGED